MPQFNLFRKPQVTPPQNLEEPDFRELDRLIEKHRAAAERFTNQQIGQTPSWGRIREAFNDAVFYNFESISQFMRFFCQNSDERKNLLEDRVKRSSNFAASSAWIIGREWASRHSALRDKLKTKEEIEIDEVPSDAMELLARAVYYLYSLFAEIFTFYYDSEYGRRTRQQKDNHLRDTYQAFMKGMFACFLSGAKSIDVESRDKGL
jgi:hypothetical protein